VRLAYVSKREALTGVPTISSLPTSGEGRRVPAMKPALMALLMCLFLFSGCALMDSVTWVIDGNEKKD
jgi:hypothetical protein